MGDLRRINYPLTLLLFILFSQSVLCDDQMVNVLFFYEELDSMKYFDAALAFIESQPALGVKVGKAHKIFSNGTDAPKLVSDLCSQIDETREGDFKADIAIDFTRIGVPSEAVKIALKVINMPTLSATFGQEGDIRSWQGLGNKNAKQYLVQISPPADMLVQAVRSIVSLQDMTSAVLLFDHQFEMYNKYKTLLQNLPTRHLLKKLATNSAAVRKQINRLVDVDIVNFFIAATPAEISGVIADASALENKDGHYFNDEFAWYSMSLETGVPKCTGCTKNVTVTHLTPDLVSNNDARLNFLTSYGKGINPNRLTDRFYFDLVLTAILVVKISLPSGKEIWNSWAGGDCTFGNVNLTLNRNCVQVRWWNLPREKSQFERCNEMFRNMKEKGEWVAPPSTVCKNVDTFDDNYKLDLYPAIRELGSENIMGPWKMEKNGWNHVIFTMNIELMIFKENQAEAEIKDNLGTWTTGFGEKDLIIQPPGKDIVWDAQKAMTVFRVVTVIQPPFIYKKEGCVESNLNKYQNCYRGFCIDLLKYLQDDLHFNYTIRNISDYGFMDPEEPHEWNGMIAELKERRADIALGALSVMVERESVVDFTVPYYDLVGISVLMKRPVTKQSLFKFLTVLENDVWFCILGAYFFTSMLMWVFDRWSPYSYQNNREKYEDDEEKREFNLKECYWFCMTSLTPQGGGEAPKNLSGRLVAATWWLFGFIIIASYTANLAAFLTVSRLDAPVETLDDLSKQYKIQYAPMKDSAAWIYFDRMAHIEHRFYEIWKDMSLNDSLSEYDRSQLAVWDYPVSDRYTKMWQAMQENEPPKDFAEGVRRVMETKGKHDGFAFLGEGTDIKYQEHTVCELQQTGEEFSRKPYAIAVQKGSPLKQPFSHMILKLLNKRELERLKDLWWETFNYRKRCPKEDNQADGISIYNIGGVFIIIGMGIVLSILTLICEVWWFRRRDIAEEMEEIESEQHEFGSNFAPVPPSQPIPPIESKTNFNTEFNAEYNQPPTNLPTIENSW